MKMRNFYLVMAVLGFFLTYGFGAAFVVLHGWDFGLFVDDTLGSTAAMSAIIDVTLATFVFWVCAVREGRRLRMTRPWAYVAATFVFGLITPLGIFLYNREKYLEPQTAS